MNQSAGVNANSAPFESEANTIPSYPIRTSRTSFTPFLRHSDNSPDFILREALAISTDSASPVSQNFAIPAPVPPPSTIGVLNSKFSPNASAAIMANGKTVELPVTCMLSLAAAAVNVANVSATLSANIFIKFPYTWQ